MQARLNVLNADIFPLHQYTSPQSSFQNGHSQHALPSSRGENGGESETPDVPGVDSQLNKHAWNFRRSDPLVGGGKCVAFLSASSFTYLWICYL